MVHGSGGINPPASPELRSEVGIIASIAAATIGSELIDWATIADDYDLVRDMIARIVPGFEGYNVRVRKPRGFRLPNSASQREWNTSTGRATFFSEALPWQTDWQRSQEAENQFVLQTFRSHDQYNTTIYGMTDRYRGIYGNREIIFINSADIERIGAKPGDLVDIEGPSEDGRRRTARGFSLVAYDIPQGCIAGYYPELNILVPLSSFGDSSDTPTSKSIMVKLHKQNTVPTRPEIVAA